MGTAVGLAQPRPSGGAPACSRSSSSRLHVVGFGLLLGFVAPQHLQLGSGVFGIGIGITAYTLGMRHAFDADHIGAIDNTTRKLMSDGQRPLERRVLLLARPLQLVFLLAILLAVGIKGLSGDVADDGSTLHQATGLIGPTVSGSFLFLIGILNLVVLIGIVRVFLRMRQGEFNEQQLEEQLNSRGFMNRFLRPGDARRQEAVAHVSARAAVRPRLRHRDRDRAARHGRHRRRGRPARSRRSCACRSCSPRA